MIINKKMRKKIISKFELEHPDVERRKNECEQILSKHPTKIPIICEKDPSCKNLPELEKTKFLVSRELTVAQFNFMVRKRAEIKEENTAFFLLANTKKGQFNLTGDILLSDIYGKYKNSDDGFLYIIYASAIAWGNNS